MTITTRLTLKGGWIDATYTPDRLSVSAEIGASPGVRSPEADQVEAPGRAGILSMAAVGPPLHYLVKTPTSIPARHKQTEERGRLRRMAVEALKAAGAPEAVGDAESLWTFRAG